MKTVRQLLDRKGHNVWSIDPDATVLDALEMLAKKDIGALVVMDGQRLVGLVAERHYARNVVLKGRTSAATPVREIMETCLVTTIPYATVEQCMVLMTETRVHHLPVLDDGRVIGIVSIGDLVEIIISEQKSTIKHLEHYIHGNGNAL
ncbi:MAG: CBS domain-containing protein [Hyphomicrobiaceae bacterium]